MVFNNAYTKRWFPRQHTDMQKGFRTSNRRSERQTLQQHSQMTATGSIIVKALVVRFTLEDPPITCIMCALRTGGTFLP